MSSRFADYVVLMNIPKPVGSSLEVMTPTRAA
jgi:hypothetical protein